MITELPENWRNRLLEGTNKTLCTPGARRKTVSPQETEPDLPVSVQGSLVEAWADSGLLQSGSLNTTVCAQVLLKEIAITFIAPTSV